MIWNGIGGFNSPMRCAQHRVWCIIIIISRSFRYRCFFCVFFCVFVCTIYNFLCFFLSSLHIAQHLQFDFVYYYQPQNESYFYDFVWIHLVLTIRVNSFSLKIHFSKMHNKLILKFIRCSKRLSFIFYLQCWLFCFFYCYLPISMLLDVLDYRGNTMCKNKFCFCFCCFLFNDSKMTNPIIVYLFSLA